MNIDHLLNGRIDEAATLSQFLPGENEYGRHTVKILLHAAMIDGRRAPSEFRIVRQESWKMREKRPTKRTKKAKTHRVSKP